MHELIETLWNVNIMIHSGYTIAQLELIETLWNVNVDETKQCICKS